MQAVLFPTRLPFAIDGAFRRERRFIALEPEGYGRAVTGFPLQRRPRDRGGRGMISAATTANTAAQ